MSHPVSVATLVGEEELSRRLHELTAGLDYRVSSTDTWLIARTTDPTEHGWKLHVSTRSATLGELAELLLPVLVEEGCSFKLAKSGAVLNRLNDGISAPAQVGKAFTVYPAPNRIRPLGERLARLLDGHIGPRILSDRRVSPTAPVYYRYGPFTSQWRSDSTGRLLSTLTGPDGERFDGPATLDYRRPAWAVDPFVDENEELSAGRSLGGRYEVTAGVVQGARGNVYRAVATGDDRSLIIKQARAFVSEDDHGMDIRSRLRNERRVLATLDGVAGVPSFIDHFRHGDDEYLVITDQGRQNLTEDVNRAGRYTEDPTRSLLRLGQRLAGILTAVHRRGVVSRDVSPKNIICDGDRISLIDFGIAALDGYQLGGSTPGYAAPAQIRGEPGRPADDAHALGMTLFFAATGAHPVPSPDGELSRLRALQALAVTPSRFAGLAGTIAALIGAEEELALRAMSRLADGVLEPVGEQVATVKLPALTPELLDEIVDGLRERLLVSARGLLADPSGLDTGNDASCYNGAAGIGLELLHHLDKPEVPELLAELGRIAAAAALRTELPPGLYLGTTGVQIFLQKLIDHGIDVPLLPDRLLEPGGGWQPEGDDLFVGRAGIGLGHLMLASSGAAKPAWHRELADRYISAMLEASSLRSPFQATDQDIDPADGRAHGLAGAVESALRLARLEPAVRPAARQLTDRLVPVAAALVRRAGEPGAVPLVVSWCRGLAGIGHTLLTAAELFGDPELLALAQAAGTGCREWIPQLSSPGQCCGLSGVGSYLVRLSQVSADSPAFLAAARQAAVQLLLRSTSTGRVPEFSELDVRFNPASWASGGAGILAFFRCLREERFEELLALPGSGHTLAKRDITV